MGMKPTSQQRQEILKRDQATAAADPRKRPIAGEVRAFIPGEPPTVTHQDKVIAMRRFGKEAARMKLVDSPALTAARTDYLKAIPINPRGPIVGPLYVRLQFRWSNAKVLEPTWRTLKPDADNAAKTLLDILCLRGWIVNDAHVSAEDLEKIDLPATSRYPAGVYVHINTIEARVDVDPVPENNWQLTPHTKETPQ